MKCHLKKYGKTFMCIFVANKSMERLAIGQTLAYYKQFKSTTVKKFY
jgi:hypothetical protein